MTKCSSYFGIQLACETPTIAWYHKNRPPGSVLLQHLVINSSWDTTTDRLLHILIICLWSKMTRQSFSLVLFFEWIRSANEHKDLSTYIQSCLPSQIHERTWRYVTKFPTNNLPMYSSLTGFYFLLFFPLRVYKNWGSITFTSNAQRVHKDEQY